MVWVLTAITAITVITPYIIIYEYYYLNSNTCAQT